MKRMKMQMSLSTLADPYGTGDGADRVSATGSGNTLRFTDGIAPGNLRLRLSLLVIQAGKERAINLEGIFAMLRPDCYLSAYSERAANTEWRRGV